MADKIKNPETIGLHGGEYRSDPTTTAVAVPIYQTTSYQFKDAKTAANLFALKEFGNIYTRINNPTCDILEKRVAALEGGLAAVAVGSGQAASAFCVQNVCQAGDNIVSSTDLYGGTVNLFKNTLSMQGIEVRFADPKDPKNFEKLTDEKTRAYYGESCPNPYLRVFPIKEVADIGKKHGIPLIIDNTAAPVICRPLEHGAAVVMHSLTKYIGGHGTSIGGIIVDSVKLDKVFAQTISEKTTSELIKFVVSVCDTLSLNMLGEGIETDDQKEKFIKIGCPNGQGYLMHRPEFIEDLKKSL